MKRTSSTRITIIILLVIVTVVGYYAYLSNKTRESQREASMTFVQEVLSRDLQLDYPPTPKEVVKYYSDITKCFYNEDCTEEEIEQLGMKARDLYDRELAEHNETETYLNNLKSEIEIFKAKKRRINHVSIASSTNVDEYMVDGFQFARLRCTYSMLEGANSKPTHLVYLLRRDDNRSWKIYGWDFAENLTIYNNTSSDEGTGNENEG